ncbi:S8 family serine peptidase [Shewanella sp. D64]|uniref:S8 family serine peptidase n=1 Tax=unclassified Shewanella TaxID=196818 RepID=UPI0022BA41D7|nr:MULTISPECIES: S8 family serine peptidase [unclassified Shewanella]MEC4727698.1 S8 family serine peptidase [Shewanella sp. D64]MEC4739729.1 S8 family serine peptidase [Shewanella sp. E94]WBJ94092.1 S8 family serine peptidase [Shewanella sp. MTB7]
MKLSKIASAIIALTVSVSTTAKADDNRYIIQVDNGNKGVVKALTNRLGGEIHIDGNGFISATFTGKDLSQVKGLLKNPHIKLVEADQRRQLMSAYSDDAGNPMTQQVTPYAVYQSQANQVAFNASAGMKVCIIDSGLDASNSDFEWNNISGDNDSGTGNWNENGGPHGTHVAGTVGAADNSVGVIGMAPGVDMHIIKVFNDDGWGYSSDLAHAANLCSAAGANIISMSLGGGGANSTESNAFQSFVDAGGLVVAAAGNDGNNVRSYPAGYPSVMMIGANDADNNIADFSQFPGCTTGRGKKVKTDETICVEVTAGGVDTLSTYPASMATASNMTVDGAAYASSAMENAGGIAGGTYYMGTAEVMDSGANGNICVIDRGMISFHDKVANCEGSGGVGAVIINNQAGMLFGTLGDTNATTIPAVGAAFEDRAAMLAASNISIDIGTSDYGFMSGTSMATPAVSGVAALVWSNHNQCSGNEIREALKATAMDAGVAGNDVYFGYGIVKAAAADAYLTANGCAGGDGGEPGGDFSLSANGYKSKGVKKVDLSFNGAAGSNVDVYRDGSIIATTSASSIYTDTITSKGGGSYTYKACDEGTTSCTSEQVVIF